MASNSQPVFDSEHPDIDSFKAFIASSLERHHLSGIYQVEDILEEACYRSTGKIDPASTLEIRLAWMKTICLEIIQELNQQHTSKRRFDIAIQALFDIENPDARSFWANVARTLHQFRLSGIYDVREIVAEAYAIGVRRIESGLVIEKPLPWLRKTCLNVIRDLRRKQSQADRPRLDGDGLTSGDEVFSDLIFVEDRKAIRLALAALSAEEQMILYARIFKNQSWQEIGESLSVPGEPSLSANTARQRGYRVLQKFRQLYDAIRQEVRITEGELLPDLDTHLE